jgi:hypothetical protein
VVALVGQQPEHVIGLVQGVARAHETRQVERDLEPGPRQAPVRNSA